MSIPSASTLSNGASCDLVARGFLFVDQTPLIAGIWQEQCEPFDLHFTVGTDSNVFELPVSVASDHSGASSMPFFQTEMGADEIDLAITHQMRWLGELNYEHLADYRAVVSYIDGSDHLTLEVGVTNGVPSRRVLITNMPASDLFAVKPHDAAFALMPIIRAHAG